MVWKNPIPDLLILECSHENSLNSSRNENSKHSTSEDKEQNVENLDLCSKSTESNNSSDDINEIPTKESAATIPRLLKLESKVLKVSFFFTAFLSL